jgi:hypothetical protein
MKADEKLLGARPAGLSSPQLAQMIIEAYDAHSQTREMLNRHPQITQISQVKLQEVTYAG